MKKMTMVITVQDDFKIGDCKECPLLEYQNCFGETCCDEGDCESYNEVCPLKEFK